MDSALSMWTEAETLNDARENKHPQLVDEMLGARLAMRESLRLLDATPTVPAGRHPLHD
jgi:hypothetical protein